MSWHYMKVNKKGSKSQEIHNMVVTLFKGTACYACRPRVAQILRRISSAADRRKQRNLQPYKFQNEKAEREQPTSRPAWCDSQSLFLLWTTAQMQKYIDTNECSLGTDSESESSVNNSNQSPMSAI